MPDEVIDHQEPVEQEAPQMTPDELVNDMQQAVEGEQEQQEPEEKMVPLSALQKERKKRQEAELHAEWQLQERQRLAQASQQQAPEEDDDSLYESATRADLNKTKKETLDEAVREVREQLWVENNPERMEFVNENLSNFLKQRPGYARVLEVSPNRYKEAYELMEAFQPRQQKAPVKPEPRKNAPNAPTSVPKSTALNATVDVMKMSDAEFREWRASKAKRR